MAVAPSSTCTMTLAWRLPFAKESMAVSPMSIVVSFVQPWAFISAAYLTTTSALELALFSVRLAPPGVLMEDTTSAPAGT